MIVIRTRIKELRKYLDMTLEEFGQNIGVKKNTISQIENGKNGITEQMIASILNASWKGKKINESWLRTGEGQMFNDLSIDGEISAWLQKIQPEDKNDFKKRCILMLSRMSDIEWEILEKKIMEIANIDEKQ